MARADPRDVLVLKAGLPRCEMKDLPAGAVVGTSSIRRTAQIALKHPHLRVQDVRGNVPTRLRKLDAEDSPFDALVIAAAGLIRLDLAHRISQYLDSSSGGMLYAVGQGAIGIETRADDQNMSRILSRIEDKPATLSCMAERSLLRTLEGGCSAPLGVETKWVQSDVLQMKAVVVSIDGSESVESEMQVTLQTATEADQFGENVAADLLRKGADRILAAIQAKKMTRPADLEEK
jgi:hydroxymethylbilane synthase